MHMVLPRTNHLPASPLFEIKLFNLTVFSSFFLLILLMHLYYSLSQSFSSFQFLNSSNGTFPLHGTARYGSLLGGSLSSCHETFQLGTVPGT